MSTLSLILKELTGMFIDDEFLAIAILIVVAFSEALAYGTEASSNTVGGVLFLGGLFVLFGSVWRARRK